LNSLTINIFAHDGIKSHYTGLGTMTMNYIETLRDLYPDACINLFTPEYNNESLGYMNEVLEKNKAIIGERGKIVECSNGSNGVYSYGDLENWKTLVENTADNLKITGVSGGDILNIILDTPYAGLLSKLNIKNCKNIWVPHSTVKIHGVDSAIENYEDYYNQRLGWENDAISYINNNPNQFVGSIGDYMKNHLIDDYGTKEEKLITFKNGFYLDSVGFGMLSDEEMNDLGIEHSDKIIISFGRAEEYKNFESTIRVGVKLEEYGFKTVLIISPYNKDQVILKQYRRLIKELGSNTIFRDDVDFYLPHRILNTNFSRMVMYIPSNKEPFGLLVEEARMVDNNDVLVVANSVDGLVEQIEDGINGLLVDSYKENEVVKKILDFDNSKKIKELSEGGKRVLRKKYNLRKNLKKGLGNIV